MKVCLYSRVSTGEQDAENQSVVLSEWALQRDFHVVETYTDQENAWRNGHQRELARLLDDAQKRKRRRKH